MQKSANKVNNKNILFSFHKNFTIYGARIIRILAESAEQTKLPANWRLPAGPLS
jgi:hypothetical protein